MGDSRVIVTGSSGFCGGVIIPKLKKLGYKNIRFKDYKVKKTLDVLFYADL